MILQCKVVKKNHQWFVCSVFIKAIGLDLLVKLLCILCQSFPLNGIQPVCDIDMLCQLE